MTQRAARSNLRLLEQLGHGRRPLTGGANVGRSQVAMRCACGWRGPLRRTTDRGVVDELVDDHLAHVLDALPRLDLAGPILGAQPRAASTHPSPTPNRPTGGSP